MQNYKKNFVTRTLAWVLAAVMVIAMVPVGVFAETYQTADGETKTTDWSEEARKKAEVEKGNWPLSKDNRLVRVSPADPVKTPDINYIGVYTNTDGREVVRFTISYNVRSANQWDKLLVKLSKVFNDMVDFQNPFNGIFKGKTSYGTHDAADMDNIKTKKYSDFKAVPELLAWNKAGGQNVYSFDLNQNGSMSPGNVELPIDFVLKEGQSVKNLKADELIQARLTDKNYQRVYTRHGEVTNDYMQYTMTTIIPKDKNFNIDVNADLSYQAYTNTTFTFNKFYTTVSSVKFNVEKGYLEVYHRQNKWATGSGYAIRQSVGSDFYKLLDERNGMVGEVYIMSADAQPYSATKAEPYEPTTKIQFAKSDINENLGKNIGFLQVAGSNWDNSNEYENGIKTKKSSNVSDTAAILNSTAATGGNAGVYTVVRYFIKKDEMKKLIKENGLKSYTFRTSILRQNENKYGTTGPTVKGITEYKLTSDKERNLKRGDKVEIKFDKAQYSSHAGTTATFIQITVGDENYNISFRDTTSFDSSGLNATWTVPFDIKIKKGETITVKSLDYKENARATKLTMHFGDSDFQVANGKVNYHPIEMLRSVSVTGGALTSTIERPNVDEIFTDSKNITGHSFFDGAEINIKYAGTDGNEVKQTISAAGSTDEDPDKVDYSKILTKAKYVNGETVDAFPFDTNKPNQGGVIQGDKKHTEFKMPKLERDMPIKVDNLDTLSSFIPSGDVIEQVQTKFHFDLNGEKSKTNLEVLDRIAPLSKEYKYDPETGKANAKYKASGFEGENVKYAEETTKEVDGRTYQNILNHDGIEYDLTKNDQKEAFLMRQMPTKDDVNVPQGKRIIGWTTKKLKDTADKTVTDQFNELKDANKVITKVEDWANVDKDQNYIFDAESPIDKERTVYAVYGEGINLILHSNNTDEIKNETTITVPIVISDVDKTDKIIDSVTSPTFNKMKGNLIIKKLPQVPVTGEDAEITKITDAKAKLFNLKDHSFIGWTTKRYTNNKDTSEFAAGNNNERIGEITQGLVDKGTKRIPQKTEWLKDLNTLQNKYYIPNGYSVAVRPQDVDRNITEIKKAIEEGKDIHLYANYRPFFEIKVHPSYKNIDKNQGDYGKYVDTVIDKKKKATKIGLLRRTAVTNFGTPTVHQNANYYPLGDAGLKDWDGTEKTLTWNLPGFDELGQRMSYVSVVVPQDKVQAYKDFKVPNWGDLGLKTYLRLQGTAATVDPNAPKNLHENAGNPYGDPVAKNQAYSLGVDAYTSATSRKAETADRQGTDEVIGYEIWNTSTPIDIPKPIFDNVLDTDTKVKLEWTDAEKNTGIEKIKLTVADGKEVVLEKQPDGSYSGGGLTATEGTDKDAGKLIIGTLDLTGKAGKDIVAKYVVKKADKEIDGPEGRVTINHKGTSAPVDRMKQVPNQDGKSVVEFDIPNPTLNKPTPGTEYVAQKWDKDNNRWVDAGKTKMENTDTLGQTKTITLDGVTNDDIIRIVSKQPDMIPAASNKDGDNAIGTNDVAGRNFVKIDAAGPEIDPVEAKDEEFRRFIDLTATLGEIPEGRIVTIEVEYTPGDKKTFTSEIKTQEDKKLLLKELNTILRKGTDENNIKPIIRIIAVDEFGNKTDKTVDYKQTYQLEVQIKQYRAGRKWVKVTADRNNSTVTLRVIKFDGSGDLTVTAPVATAGEFVKVDFGGYQLKPGDKIEVKGTCQEGDKTYTANPMILDI